MNDNRDPQTVGNRILELRKKNPNISTANIADLVLSPIANYDDEKNGHHVDKRGN